MVSWGGTGRPTFSQVQPCALPASRELRVAKASRRDESVVRVCQALCAALQCVRLCLLLARAERQ
eukprot:scaffold4204_cov140-Isochrysis_galbana.AAC.11